MTSTEERLRAATRAAADTVPPGSAPPLRLPGAQPGRARWDQRHRWIRAMVPLAAAAAVAAVVIASLALTGGVPTSSPGGSASPAKTVALHGVPVVTTNDGTLVEDTSLDPPGGCAPFPSQCGKWRFSTSGAELMAFKWEQPKGAGTVDATGLVTMPGSWAYFGWGTDTLRARCLAWHAPQGEQYIEMNKEGGTWHKTNPSGGTLIVQGARDGPLPATVTGILRRGRFIPLPGAPLTTDNVAW